MDGALVALMSAFLLPERIGTVPFPVSAIVGGLANAALVWAAMHWTTSVRAAAAPLWCWLATVAVLTLGGPGDGIVFTGVVTPLLLIVAGALPPGWMLRRRIRAGG
jgi:hypothetical protein